MRRILLMSLVMLASLCLAPARAENWERFRGPGGLGVAPATNIPVIFDEKTNVIWKLPVTGQGNSCPIIWGDHLFLQTATKDSKKRLLVCIDVKAGKELWSRGIAGFQVEKNHLNPKNSLASATAVTDGEAVYVPFWDGKDVFLIAYNFKGEELWNKPFGRFSSQHGFGISPILFKDKVIFYNDQDKTDQFTKQPVPNPAMLYALNKKNGEVIWKLPREAFRACYSEPFILEKPGTAPELIVTSTTSIASYNPDTGAQNWSWNNWNFKGMPLRTVGSTLYHDGMLFSGAGDGGGPRQMCAIALGGAGKNAQPKSLWNNAKDFPYVPCLLARGEHIYFVNDAGFAGCYEAKTGKRIWFERMETNLHFTASPILIGDKVYAPSEEGDVFVFSATPDTYTLLAKNHLGERLMATPAVANGRLYIREQNQLFCIGMK